MDGFYSKADIQAETREHSETQAVSDEKTK